MFSSNIRVFISILSRHPALSRYQPVPCPALCWLSIVRKSSWIVLERLSASQLLFRKVWPKLQQCRGPCGWRLFSHLATRHPSAPLCSPAFRSTALLGQGMRFSLLRIYIYFLSPSSLGSPRDLCFQCLCKDCIFPLNVSLIGKAEVVEICSQIEGQHDTCFFTEKVLVRNFTLINVMQIELSLKTD